jgi:hydroxymethylpyrimidine pyrophosphatase-like HAD family hydrolase
VVYEAETNELHRIRALSRAEVSEILSHVRRHFAGATVAIDGTRTRVVDPTWPEGTASVVSQPQLWPLDPHTLPRVAVICIMVLNAWSDHRDVPRDWPVTVTSSASGLIEFSAGLANKLSALRWYCKRAGISLTDVLAFGDMPNDLDVLTSVGVGVAVGNAHEAVLAAANFVALTNDQDGVAAFLETHVLDRLSASVRPNPQVAI